MFNVGARNALNSPVFKKKVQESLSVTADAFNDPIKHVATKFGPSSAALVTGANIFKSAKEYKGYYDKVDESANKYLAEKPGSYDRISKNIDLGMRYNSEYGGKRKMRKMRRTRNTRKTRKTRNTRNTRNTRKTKRVRKTRKN